MLGPKNCNINARKNRPEASASPQPEPVMLNLAQQVAGILDLP